ncbi:MAG: hypothetical protein JST22_04655 [Bacteroidetes bacterium]|nr:hypothetical protein [Bacteroidota bacterium]
MERSTEHERRYRSTESKYKGGAAEMYVTYDLDQRTRGGNSSSYPKVKRVYIAGDVKEWSLGCSRKKSGREVYGVTIEYRQSRSAHHRHGYVAKRDHAAYRTAPASVKSATQHFRQVVEIPEHARNVHFYRSANRMPARYRHALQHIR